MPSTTPTRVVDTVIFDVGGVLATTGRHSDFADASRPRWPSR